MAAVQPGTNWTASAMIRPIQVPMAIGAMKSGVDRGAAEVERSLRTQLADRQRASILKRLLQSEVVPVAPLDASDVRRHPGQALHLEAVADACDVLGQKVSTAISRGELALTLGGDHALSIGSIAGASFHCQRLAVIWIDAHADMNWPEVSPSGRIHGMSLGSSMGRGPARLTELLGASPKVRPEDVYVVGARQLDPAEEDWFREGECHLVTMQDVDRLGIEGALQDVIAGILASDADAVHLSFDLDSLDPIVFPGTGAPVRGGFTYREACRILRLLRDADLPIRSVDWVELNPDLDPTGESTEIAAELLALLLGEDVFRR